VTKKKAKLTDKPAFFLSYSRDDETRARTIEKALTDFGVDVWRDARIAGGADWFFALQAGLRQARGVVILISDSSLKSDWVAYEFAFAMGADKPVVIVSLIKKTKLPDPMNRFQTVEFSNRKGLAQEIYDGIVEQSRRTMRERASSPTLVAKFQEKDGQVNRLSDERIPSLGLELWVEHVPPSTMSVSFEILDIGFHDPKWTVRRERTPAPREFLTDEDLNSYGDIEIWARGKNWATTSRLYEALMRYYSGRPINKDTRRALTQIRNN
jgi:hypothetical protein